MCIRDSFKLLLQDRKRDKTTMQHVLMVPLPEAWRQDSKQSTVQHGSSRYHFSNKQSGMCSCYYISGPEDWQPFVKNNNLTFDILKITEEFSMCTAELSFFFIFFFLISVLLKVVFPFIGVPKTAVLNSL